ncbi:TROVE domain-containing protein [Streptomyces sp. C10-9-1]|uniref:TROVE domain-containing protein n=1 Tax=Streptomyces sp. C10-9-1 TaxID=1859285 RepID=UPI003F4A1074
MSRFNSRADRPPRTTSPVLTTGETTHTAEGGTGYLRDAQSELFLLAVTNLVGQDTFYETAATRDSRYTRLVRALAVLEPAWTAALLRWLRNEANLRTAAIVGAAEFVHARLAHDHQAAMTPGPSAHLGAAPYSNRAVIASVLQRADEPGELVAYWEKRFGHERRDGQYDVRLPLPVKRGIADAVQRLYTERALLKYDTAAVAKRFGDVLELAHPRPAADRHWQGDLFKHALDRRHGRDEPLPDRLAMLRQRQALMTMPVQDRRALLLNAHDRQLLDEAGMTWESLAGWLQGPMDAPAWEAIIPSMGYMALLRNLRNFDEAGVSDQAAAAVCAVLADPEQVARSRQLPLRFLSAYNAAPSLRWGHALEQALTASLANIPHLDGRTLVLVDTSTSMNAGFSRDGSLKRWDAATLFGIALAHRCAAADVVSFSSARYYLSDPPGARTKAFPLQRGESVLRAIGRWRDGGWFLGGGTDTAAALRAEFCGHDRVVIVTDEQASHDHTEVDRSIPQTVPMYTWNLAGYEAGHAPSGRGHRHTFGGLTDHAFRMIPLLETSATGTWPWETESAGA